MLSGETAIGEDPANVVRTMSRIAGLADEKFDYELWAERLAELRMTDTATGAASVTDATMAERPSGHQDDPGHLGHRVHEIDGEVPAAGADPVSHNRATVQQLTLSWGTVPVRTRAPDGMVTQAVRVARDAPASWWQYNRSRSANVSPLALQRRHLKPGRYWIFEKSFH